MGLFSGETVVVVAALLFILSFTSMEVAGTVTAREVHTTLDLSQDQAVLAHHQLHALLKYQHPTEQGEECQGKN